MKTLEQFILQPPQIPTVKVLKDMVLDKSVQCLGRGKQAKWRRIG